MKYYSTNGKAAQATLEEAVVKGLASDKGLFMPEKIKALPKEFFDNRLRPAARTICPQKKRTACTLAGRSVFFPTYTPPEKMI